MSQGGGGAGGGGGGAGGAGAGGGAGAAGAAGAGAAGVGALGAGGDWRKGSADIKLLLKNLYSQSPMPHTDVTFKVTALKQSNIS